MTPKEKFLHILRNPGGYTECVVAVTVPNCPSNERIINPIENFAGKADYYDKAYDDELRLKAFPSIYITAYTFSETVCEAPSVYVKRPYKEVLR